MANIEDIQDSSGKVLYKMTYNPITGKVDVEGDNVGREALKDGEFRFYPAHFEHGYVEQVSIGTYSGSPWYSESISSGTNKGKKEDMKRMKTKKFGKVFIVNTETHEKVLEEEVFVDGSLSKVKLREYFLHRFHDKLYKDKTTLPDHLDIGFLEILSYDYEVEESKE